MGRLQALKPDIRSEHRFCAVSGFYVVEIIEKEGKEVNCMNLMKRFLIEEDGLSTVEIVLILVVLVGLVLIFKEEMIQIVESIFKTITKQINKV